jgi:hypothetical protein
MFRPHLPAILIALILCGCCGPCAALPDRNIKRTVAPEEIVGTWKLTPDTVELIHRNHLKESPEHAYTVTLNADGSMKFASVHQEGVGMFQYIEAEGKWSLGLDSVIGDPSRKHYQLDITIDESGKRLTERFGLTDMNGKLVLWRFLGDPDSWEFIEYERVK